MKYKLIASLVLPMFVLLVSSAATAAPILVSPSPASFGEIERITLNDPANVYSGGVIFVGGTEMILPKNLLIDLPANRLSLQQIFDQAPAACKALGESGLAKADRCNGTGSGGIATLSAVRTNAGNVIVGDLFIQKAAESVNGMVTYINYDQGYYRVNGILNDPSTGAMVRLNDPNSRHTIQSGAGCAGGPNCSPDPRFNLDPDNYTNTFATGYPVCIPSTVPRAFSGLAGAPAVPAGTAVAAANGTGDLLCPDTNRSPGVVNEPAVADSRRFAPVMVGDSVLAEGNYETIGGVRFLSAHSSTVQKALSTQNVAGQPDYLFLEEVGYEAPPYQNQRLIALLIGFTTLAPTDVDLWSLHRDPVNNAIHEFPFASVQGCDNAQGGPGNCSAVGLVNAGANIFKIRYDIDFLNGVDPKSSPCSHLRLSPRFAVSHPGICSGGATTAKDIAVMSPVPHEIVARTGRKIDSDTNPAIGTLITIDVNGNPATNGEYLFPLGLNLGGLGVAEMSEVDINVLNTPIPFEGIPWNLDRRLGPSGCLNDGGCEAGTVGSTAFALDPFPFSGLDPRLQASLLPNVSYIDPVFSPTTLTSSRNRMFSYVSGTNFNGNATVIPYALGVFPVDPPLIPINPTPIFNVFPPITLGDSVSTNAGVPVVISVLANDIAVLGIIDPTSVVIASNPASGSALVNLPAGTITYTPAAGVTVGTATFSYTVANNAGSVSLPGTVTVSIAPVNQLPVAVHDSATVAAGNPIAINVILNDSDADGFINPASITITSAPAHGTAVAQSNGTVLYTSNPAFTGADSFGYTVVDNQGAISTVATVDIAVTLPLVLPAVVNDSTTISTGSSVVLNVTSNDIPGSNPINASSVSVTGVPLNGTVIANAGGPGTISYTPAAGFTGIDSFTYNVSDTKGNVSPTNATVSVTVTATSTLTISAGPLFFTNINSLVIAGAVEAGAQVTIAVNTTASAGAVSISGPGGTAWSSTISNLVLGVNVVTVTATDAAGNSTVQSATITFDANPFVKRLGDTLTGSVIQPLYDGIPLTTSDTIQLRSVTITESPIFDRAGVTVNLKGGYDTGFVLASGVTAIKGTMIIRQGTVNVSNLVIK